MTQSPEQKGVRGFIRSFTAVMGLPLAFWVVVGAFVLESMSYFGVLTLMTSYLTRDLGFATKWATGFVSIFTMLVTLFMLGAGSYAESFGLRKAVLAALFLCVAGRLLFTAIPSLTGEGATATSSAAGGEDGFWNPGAMVVWMMIAALVIIALGEAILQPVCYSGVKQYTDEATSSMGYGLIYAFMNAGIVVAGELSARFRPAVQNVIEGRASGQTGILDGVSRWLAGNVGSGIQAVNWICLGITSLTLVLVAITFTKGVEARKLRPDRAEEMRKADARPAWRKFREYFTAGPFANPRFIFFIFMLLPVRTLFAHQWLTMPEYVLRAYDKDVADNMERLVNWINPAIIFFGVPVATALTRRVNVYTMMIVGSLVSAVPTYLLCGGPSLTLLISYFVMFSIGEALWSARFLEYASELAPEGRLAQYMGLANIPWLLAKGTTGLYAGLMLDHYCKAGLPVEQQQTGTLWFIYGCIAMASPIGLWLARGWVMKGLHAKVAKA